MDRNEVTELKILLGACDNDLRLEDFYRSGDPETSLNHPLPDYVYRLTHKPSKSGGRGIFLGADAAAGQILLVENTEVFCVCVGEYVTNYNSCSFTHAPTRVGAPSSCRIPRKAHEHLAGKLAEMIRIRDVTAASRDCDLKVWIQYLDARRLSSGALPNLDSVERSLTPKNRGPWVRTAHGGRNLVFDRVWDIVANNAICEKVRFIGKERGRKVETCDLWGLWPQSSLINHSCSPNCHGKVVGNARIVRAAMAMVSGDELTLPYFDIFEPLRNRELAAEKWGFRCTCARCAFEGTLGKRYDDIEGAIVNLKQQLQSSWTLMNDVETRQRVGKRLLEKLALKIFPTENLINECRLKALVQMKEARQGPLDARDMPDGREICWLRASLLIEPLIALYALCQTGSLGDPFRDFLQPLDVRRRRRTEEAINRWREIMSIDGILNVLISLYPGNLLSQEFISIFHKAFDEFSACDFEENLPWNRNYKETCTNRGIVWCHSYYDTDADKQYIKEVLIAPSIDGWEGGNGKDPGFRYFMLSRNLMEAEGARARGNGSGEGDGKNAQVSRDVVRREGPNLTRGLETRSVLSNIKRIASESKEEVDAIFGAKFFLNVIGGEIAKHILKTGMWQDTNSPCRNFDDFNHEYTRLVEDRNNNAHGIGLLSCAHQVSDVFQKYPFLKRDYLWVFKHTQFLLKKNRADQIRAREEGSGSR